MLDKFCIIGNGITSLMLTKVLLDLNIKVDLFNQSYSIKKTNSSRTVAISRSNFLFLKKSNILNNNSLSFWKINEIRLFNSKIKRSNKMILNFKNNNHPVFYMVKNDELFFKLKKKINQNNYLKILNKKNFINLCEKNDNLNNYNLIINCSNSNKINEKFFSRKIKKNYDATAFTTIINHNKKNNNIATQYFTELGPIAFLPLSQLQTSVVWSVNSNLITTEKIKKEIINLSSLNFKINSISKIKKFKLNFSIPRDYFKKNILTFGDGLHQIHPLAGQGLNMVIRDIKIFKSIIEEKLNLGLELDTSILSEFCNRTKPYNYLFAIGIDLTEKYFSINNKTFNKYSDLFFSKINNNSNFKNILMKIADKGLNY